MKFFISFCFALLFSYSSVCLSPQTKAYSLAAPVKPPRLKKKANQVKEITIKPVVFEKEFKKHNRKQAKKRDKNLTPLPKHPKPLKRGQKRKDYYGRDPFYYEMDAPLLVYEKEPVSSYRPVSATQSKKTQKEVEPSSSQVTKVSKIEAHRQKQREKEMERRQELERKKEEWHNVIEERMARIKEIEAASKRDPAGFFEELNQRENPNFFQKALAAEKKIREQQIDQAKEERHKYEVLLNEDDDSPTPPPPSPERGRVNFSPNLHIYEELSFVNEEAWELEENLLGEEGEVSDSGLRIGFQASKFPGLKIPCIFLGLRRSKSLLKIPIIEEEEIEQVKEADPVDNYFEAPKKFTFRSKVLRSPRAFSKFA